MSFRLGHIGRALFARLRPDEDLVATIETIAKEAGFRHAILRGSLGSVNNPTLFISDQEIHVPHLGLEITGLYGEIRHGTATLTGTLVNGKGQLFAGQFVKGKCPICVTAEITLEEWLETGDEQTLEEITKLSEDAGLYG